MKKVRNLIVLFFLVLGLVLAICIDENKIYEKDIEELIIEDSNTLALKLETAPGSGIYEESPTTSWPGDGYIFNAELSRCENGSILTYDANTNSVTVDASISDKCYIYFDRVE